MRSFFDLKHIFVVFHPGSAGNFLSGLLNKVVQNDISTTPQISKNGSSHTVDNLYMSFGRTPDDQIFYNTREDKEQYYLSQIKKYYIDVNTPQISWTHDFSNIEFYKKHFKNSKIVCITTDTIPEKLSCIFMNITKTMLDDPDNWPISADVKKFRTLRLDRACRIILREVLKPQYISQIDEIYHLRYTERYKSLFEFIYMRLLLTNVGILSNVEDSKRLEHDVFNYVICPSSNIRSIYYTIGSHISIYTCLANYCLPYSSLCCLDYKSVEDMISVVLDRKITVNESTFIHTALDKYVSSQNKQLLTDPVFYYNYIKQQCSDFIIGDE
jgi:hypothetical protein